MTCDHKFNIRSYAKQWNRSPFPQPVAKQTMLPSSNYFPLAKQTMLPSSNYFTISILRSSSFFTGQNSREIFRFDQHVVDKLYLSSFFLILLN